MNRWIVLVILVLCVGTLAATFLAGNQHGKNVERVKWQQKSAELVSNALNEERSKQKEVNDAIQKQADELAGINISLSAQLVELRSRAARLSEAARAHCKGSTGSELSREDAEFLTREAARADELRAALKACYEYADSIK